MSEITTNHLVKRASALNNHGAVLIVQGDRKRATAAFQGALAVMKDASSASAGLTDHENQERSDVADHSHPFRAFVAGVQTASHKTPINEEHSIYTRPFVFDESLIPTQDIALPLYSAVILFNLGLSLHDEALTDSEVCLRRAAHIYRMCLQILETIAQHCPSAVVVAVAALNNKAAIHFELCEYIESKTCWVLLSQLFASAQAVMRVGMDATALERIFMNVQTADFPSAAGAA